jgi:hypothetical protein
MPEAADPLGDRRDPDGERQVKLAAVAGRPQRNARVQVLDVQALFVLARGARRASGTALPVAAAAS